MTGSKTLQGYPAPEFKELSLTCEAGFAISNEALDGENWDWETPQA